MTDTNTAEREAFEAWCIKQGRNIKRAIEEYSHEYESTMVQKDWEVWQACAEAMRGFDAADMATASAQGFRDGAASLAASAGSEPVANNRPSLEAVFRNLSDRAYCNYIEQMGRNECLGWEYKVKHGTFGQAELEAHRLAGRLFGRHHAFAEAANALRGSDAPLTHPSPPEGMAGWMPIETAPKDRLVDILNAGRRYAGCHYDRICGEYRHVTACGVLIRLKNATHWMPAPPLPASEAKEL